MGEKGNGNAFTIKRNDKMYKLYDKSKMLNAQKS